MDYQGKMVLMDRQDHLVHVVNLVILEMMALQGHRARQDNLETQYVINKRGTVACS